MLTSGDGYVEMTVGETGRARIFGFSHTDTNQNWDTLDFGLHCSNHADNAIYVYESGTERGTFGAYAVGDKLRVSIIGGVVKYSRNGTVFYTSAVTPVYPLRVDAALYDTGTTLMSGVVSGNLSGGGPSSNIQWLVTDQLGTPRMVFDKTGSLANMKRHDYLPFGEDLSANQGLRTAALGYNPDGLRQKFTSKERDNETGLDYFGARYYSSPQGRFTSVDPLLASGRAASPQSWNRYPYADNNPLRYTDPTGMAPGDFYDKDGAQIGSDGINDGKVYVVFDKKEVKSAQQATDNGQTLSAGSLKSDVELPGGAVRDAIGIDSVNRSNSPTADDKKGGFHEDGDRYGLDAKGNQIVVPAASGPVADPSKHEEAKIDLTTPANPAQAGSIVTLQGKDHVHGRGEIQGRTPFEPAGRFDQGPSTRDMANADAPVNIEVGAGNKTVSFYNRQKVIGTIKLDVFLKVGRH